MTIPIGADVGYSVALTTGDQLYDTNFHPFKVMTAAAAVTGYFYSGAYVAIKVKTSGVVQLAFVKTSAVTVTPKPAPDCSAVQHELDLANGRIHSAVTVLGGTL